MFRAIPIPPPSRLPCGRCLWPYGVALSPAPWLAACPVRCQLAAVLAPLWPCRWLYPAPAGRSRWPGPPAAASPCVALRQSRRESRESRWHSRSTPCESRCQSRCESRKRLAKGAHLPQNHSRLQNSVYKGGIFLAHFPIVNGKSCKSRSISAHFTSKSLASMYFCWSCSGVKPSICGWFGVKTISCLSTMP